LSLAKADFLRSEGRYDDAEAMLQQGLDRAPTGGRERLELAMASLLLETGRRREAIDLVRRIDIGLSRHRIVHGVLAARARDFDTASAILARIKTEAAASGAPRPVARVHQLRAEISLARGDGGAAREAAALAVQAFPTPWTLTTLARAQAAVGRRDEAIKTWTSILEPPGARAMDWDAPAYSQVVLATYELARLLEETGRTAEARIAYDEFLRFWERADPDLPRLSDARTRRARLAGHGAQSTPAGRVPKPAA
jgi:tetratricopeptide (TPR) repeat protein